MLNNKGFTLIDLLFAIAIILVIFAMILPIFQQRINPEYFILTCDGKTIDKKVIIINRYSELDSEIFVLNDNSEYKCYKYSLEKVK